MGTEPGLGVDARGGPVVDPTANVLNLVEAAVERLDDLRNQEAAHVREILALRSHYMEELREAESARIDAIRRVDVEAVQRAAQVQATQATALADQVAAAAEAMRTQVAAAATGSATALSAALDPIKTDIADLRRAQYEAAGQKTQVVETQAGGRNIALWIALVVSILGLGVALIGAVVTVLVAT
jgi:hypothetical protein